MDFETYLKSSEALKPKELCARLGVSKGRLSQLRNGAEWPAHLALAAEEATDGQLDASLLSSIVEKARRTAA
jgi:DNA-binding transcriptional regulator YdaS (Cro superfamily)